MVKDKAETVEDVTPSRKVVLGEDTFSGECVLCGERLIYKFVGKDKKRRKEVVDRGECKCSEEDITEYVRGKDGGK